MLKTSALPQRERGRKRNRSIFCRRESNQACSNGEIGDGETGADAEGSWQCVLSEGKTWRSDRFLHEAIALQPNVAVYWTNRALCFRKRKEWTRVEEDCKRALQLDRNSHKAHYMLGLALLEKEDYTGAISELGKAWDILRSIYPQNEKADEIWRVLAKAKFLEWELTSSEHQWRLQNLKEICENAIREYNFLHEESGDSAPNHLAEQLQLLNEVFEKASLADVPTDVPDYLCCKITFDIFTDPVLTPSGITYERSALLEHLRTVGNFDPITRKPLKESELIPNLAIKGAVQAYLKEHGWAYNMG